MVIAAVAAMMACSAGWSLAATPPPAPRAPSGTASAAAAGPACDSKHLADIDGDDRADTLVGMPSYTATKTGRTGAVDVNGTASGAHLLRAGDFGAAAGEAGGFGGAIAMADLDGDWCVDAVIGAPNEQSDAAAGGSGGPGQVYVVFGSRDGLDPDTAVRLPRPATTVADGFGGALTLVSLRAELNDTRDHYLYVGAPARPSTARLRPARSGATGSPPAAPTG